MRGSLRCSSDPRRCADAAVCGDDLSTSWLDDYCPDEETSWFDEDGDAFEAAFRDWFEREVAPTL